MSFRELINIVCILRVYYMPTYLVMFTLVFMSSPVVIQNLHLRRAPEGALNPPR